MSTTGLFPTWLDLPSFTLGFGVCMVAFAFLFYDVLRTLRMKLAKPSNEGGNAVDSEQGANHRSYTIYVVNTTTQGERAKGGDACNDGEVKETPNIDGCGYKGGGTDRKVHNG